MMMSVVSRDVNQIIHTYKIIPIALFVVENRKEVEGHEMGKHGH